METDNPNSLWCFTKKADSDYQWLVIWIVSFAVFSQCTFLMIKFYLTGLETTTLPSGFRSTRKLIQQSVLTLWLLLLLKQLLCLQVYLKTYATSTVRTYFMVASAAYQEHIIIQKHIFALNPSYSIYFYFVCKAIVLIVYTKLSYLNFTYLIMFNYTHYRS